MRKYQSEATVRSYQKMKADAKAGDPDAIARYEAPVSYTHLHLTLDMMRVIMGEEKKSDLDRVTFTSDTLRKYFPKS